MLGSAPGAALFFFTYESSKRLLSYFKPDNPMLCFVMASVMGELVACTVRVPVENVKQKMQVKQFGTLKEAIAGIYRRGGVLAFYRGFAPTIFREIPFACIQFPLYESLKKLYGSTEMSGLQMASCGAVAGGIAAAVTTPFDVIKTRSMLASYNDASYGNMYDSFNQIIKTGGIKRLFSGIAPRILWISLGGSIFFGTYEKIIEITNGIQ